MAPKIVCVVGPTACGKTTLGHNTKSSSPQWTCFIYFCDLIDQPNPCTMLQKLHHKIGKEQKGKQFSCIDQGVHQNIN